MMLRIFGSLLLVSGIHAYSMDTDFSYVSAKGLAYAYGYSYVVQLREDNTHSIFLPKKQFEAACLAEKLPLDIQRVIKKELGIGPLQSRWAQSYLVQSCLQIPDYDAAKKEIYLAYSKQGLLAAANDAITIWNPAKSKGHCAFFGFSHPLETRRTRECIAFVADNKIAEGVRDEIRIWDIEKQIIVSKLKLPVWDISHMVPHSMGLAFIAKIEEKPEGFECDGVMFYQKVITYRQAAISWNLQTNLHEEAAWHVHSLALSDDKKTAAFGTSNGMVEVCDISQKNNPQLIVRYDGCGYTFDIDLLAFLTPTLIASASSKKGSLVLYDVIANTSSSCGMSDHVLNLKRINHANLAVLTFRHALQSDNFKVYLEIFNTTRRYVHTILVPCQNIHAFATDAHNTIAVGCRGGNIMLLRPRLPEIPENIDVIPFVAYAFAANDDTYE